MCLGSSQEEVGWGRSAWLRLFVSAAVEPEPWNGFLEGLSKQRPAMFLLLTEKLDREAL